MYDNLKYPQNFFTESQKKFYNHLKLDNPLFKSANIVSFFIKYYLQRHEPRKSKKLSGFASQNV